MAVNQSLKLIRALNFLQPVHIKLQCIRQRGIEMTLITIEVQDAQHQLAELLKLVATGTEIILTEDQKPRARLVPIIPQALHRVPGLHPGSMIPTHDFDDPLPDEFWTGTP